MLVAPPGAGKTTVIPLALLDEPWLDDRRIVMLEPRRLATRAAARRMAATTRTEVGGLVGYQTRDERHIGAATRIEVVTEGVLTRRLQNDPELPGVGLVIFDEVHERNLTTDLGLALALDVASTIRPDLRVLAMSATPDVEGLTSLLDAPVVSSEGRMFDVDVHWMPRAPSGGGRSGARSGGGRGRSRPGAVGGNHRIEPDVVAAVQRALRDQTGDVLVFLPGIGEIRRTESMLRDAVGADVDVFPLAGALTLAEQDAALAPSRPGRRRVVLSTDIAETSLTVDGVRVVVDSGLAREPRFDARTGMTRLTTVSTSRASAEQRAGRAGRTEPGAAYRLWSKLEHGTRSKHRSPEITQADLAGFALELAAWGGADELRFIDAPPAGALAQGRELLADLHAIDADGSITPLGRTMLGLPVHPRLARMVAVDRSSLACVIADVGRRTRHLPGPPRRPARRPGAAHRCADRTTGPRRCRPRRRSSSAGPGRAISPDGPASASTSTTSIPIGPASSCCSATPTGWPPGDAPASSNSAPVRARGCPTTTRSRTRRSSSPPISTAVASEPGSASPRWSTPTTSSPSSARRSSSAGRSSGTPAATTSSRRSNGGSDRSSSASVSAVPNRATRPPRH